MSELGTGTLLSYMVAAGMCIIAFLVILNWIYEAGERNRKESERIQKEWEIFRLGPNDPRNTRK